MNQNPEFSMSREEEHFRFWRSPASPDMSHYPFDQPATMKRIRENGLEVVTVGTLDAIERELRDMTERCRTTEQRVRAAYEPQER